MNFEKLNEIRKEQWELRKKMEGLEQKLVTFVYEELFGSEKQPVSVSINLPDVGSILDEKAFGEKVIEVVKEALRRGLIGKNEKN